MYVRKVGAQELTLQVSGKLWMRSLIMSDVETETEWSHLLGKAMAGALKGESLKPLITDMVTWGRWREQHPDTTILKMSRTSKAYNRDFYRDPRRFVFGFQINGHPMTLGMHQMIEKPIREFEADGLPLLATYDADAVVTHLFDRRLGNETYDFRPADGVTMKDMQTRSVWNVNTGEAIAGELKGKRLTQRVGIMSYRRVWQTFHPTSADAVDDH